MKKIALLLVVVLSVTLLFAACNPSYSWDDAEKDIETLKEAGFTVYIENTEEARKENAESLNKELKRFGKDSSVELVNICGLLINKYDIVVFEEFKTEKQAITVFDYIQEVSPGYKAVRFGKIIIGGNAQELLELLDYDFK